MAGFLDNIDTSEVKYTENYKPVSKSTTMRVDTDIKKELKKKEVDIRRRKSQINHRYRTKKY